jgi:beta-galactosidase
MIQSYDSRWSMDFQRHHKDFDPVKEFTAFYKPLVHTVQTLDIVSPEMSLDRYKLVVAPALNVLTTAQAERLAAYVRAGGHLVLGPRSGMKDDDNSLWTTRQPGPLKDVLGGHVEQYYALEKPIALDGVTGTGQAAIWGEELVADAADTRVLMHYTDGSWLAGKPAALTRNVGKGTITYLGAWLDDATMRRFLAAAAAEAGAKPVLTAPDDIEVCERRGDDKRIIVVINHGSQKHSLRLPQPMRDVLRGAGVQSTLSLPPHGVAVLLSKGKTAP